METWDAICTRRNVRVYEDGPLSAEELDRIVEAGWRSPSAQNLQRWDFVVCTDRAQLQALSGIWRGAGHLAGAAAAIVMVAPVTERAQDPPAHRVRPRSGDDGDDAGRGRPRHRQRALLGRRPGRGPTDPGRTRGPLLRLHAGPGPAGRPTPASHPAPRSATLRRGRPPGRLVARCRWADVARATAPVGDRDGGQVVGDWCGSGGLRSGALIRGLIRRPFRPRARGRCRRPTRRRAARSGRGRPCRCRCPRRTR